MSTPTATGSPMSLRPGSGQSAHNLSRERKILMHRLSDIQSAIRAEGLDGWLLYDFKGLNPIALRVAGIPADRFLSRRWACFIPAAGEPRWLAHAIEAGGLRDLAPDSATYVSWQSWRDGLATLLKPARAAWRWRSRPAARSPTSAGWMRGRSSWCAAWASKWSRPPISSRWPRRSGRTSNLPAIAAPAPRSSRSRTRPLRTCVNGWTGGLPVTECGIQDFMMAQFAERGLETDHPPIVAVNAHAADPHFAPRRDADTPLRPGDFLLLDLWGREPHPDAIYGDITWVGYAGLPVPPRIREVFEIVRQARDAAVSFVRRRIRAGQTVYGYEVDDACRAVIAAAGLGRSLHPSHRPLHRHERARQRRQPGQPGNPGSPPADPRRRLLRGAGHLPARGRLRRAAGDQLPCRRGRHRGDHAAVAGRDGHSGLMVEHCSVRQFPVVRTADRETNCAVLRLRDHSTTGS